MYKIHNNFNRKDRRKPFVPKSTVIFIIVEIEKG